MITVIIPSATDDLLRRCLASIARTEPRWSARHRIFVIDDGLGSVKDEFPNVEFIPGAKPFVFSRNVNIGMNMADEASHLFVLNDDVEIRSPQLLDTMDRLLDQYPGYGILSPRILQNVGNPDQMIAWPEIIHRTERTICFVAAVLRAEMWNALGPLDERFEGYGFEDDDYSLRAVLAGWHLGVVGCNLAVVDHRYHGTFGSWDGRRLREAFEENKRRFIEKYGEETLRQYRLWGPDNPHLRRTLG